MWEMLSCLDPIVENRSREDGVTYMGIRKLRLRRNPGIVSLLQVDKSKVTKYSEYLLNDWIVMVGVPGINDKVLEFCEFIREGTQDDEKEYRYIDDISEMCFFNVDGHSWEFYSHQEDIFDVLRKAWAVDPSM